MKTVFLRISAAAGCMLLLLNIYGLSRSMRNDDIYREKTFFKNDITLSYKEILPQMKRQPNESDLEFTKRTNSLVNKSIAHYWNDKGKDRYCLRIPPWENYLLFTASFLASDLYGKYEFVNHKKALERGVGLCSQSAMALAGLLQKNHIKNQILALGGHIVVRAKTGSSQWIIADPDYGIIVPYDIKVIESDPDIVIPYYDGIRNMYRYPRSDRTAKEIAQLYKKDKNRIYPNGISEYAGNKRYAVEYLSYLFIWIFPFLLTLPFFINLLQNRFRSPL